VLILILVGNYLYHTAETDAQLRRIFWKQSEIITDTIALSATQTIAGTRIPHDTLDFYVRELAAKLQQEQLQSGPQAQARLEEIRLNNQLELIQIFDSEGRLKLGSPQGKLPRAQGPVFALPREQGGSILISLGTPKMLDFKMKLALQELATTSRDRRLVQAISFYGPNLVKVASTNEETIGQRASRSEIEAALKYKTPFFPPSAANFEVIQAFPIEGEHWGVFHVAIDTEEIKRVSLANRQNALVAAAILFVLILLITGAMLRFHFLYLNRMERVEAQRIEQEKMLSLATLAAGVAHEIRNPLNSISITIQRLQLEFEPPQPNEAREYQSFLGLMSKEVSRLNQIVTDFLGFSKPFDPKNKVFSMRDFVQECLMQVTPVAEAKGVRLAAEVQLNGNQYYGDEEKLKQVVLNLVGNALDATPAGKGIFFKTSLDKKETWHIEIVDEGEGIPKEKLKRLFDIYFTTKKNGTGLGLYISRKILQAHGGGIELKNNPKDGVTCSVFLPKRVPEDHAPGTTA